MHASQWKVLGSFLFPSLLEEQGVSMSRLTQV